MTRIDQWAQRTSQWETEVQLWAERIHHVVLIKKTEEDSQYI